MSRNIIYLAKSRALLDGHKQSQKEDLTDQEVQSRYQTAQALSHCLRSLLEDAEAADLTLSSTVIRLAIEAIGYDLARGGGP